MSKKEIVFDNFFSLHEDMKEKITPDLFNNIISFLNLVKGYNLEDLEKIYNCIINYYTNGIILLKNKIKKILDRNIGEVDYIRRDYSIFENVNLIYNNEEINIPYCISIIENILYDSDEFDSIDFCNLSLISEDYIELDNETVLKREKNETLERFIKRAMDNY